MASLMLFLCDNSFWGLCDRRGGTTVSTASCDPGDGQVPTQYGLRTGPVTVKCRAMLWGSEQTGRVPELLWEGGMSGLC